MSSATVQEAQRAHEAGQLDRAEHLYLAHLQRQGNDRAVQYSLGLLYLQQRQAERAVELLSRLATERAAAEVHCHLGIALSLADRHDEAIAALRSAAKRAENSADTHYNLGNALHRAKQHIEATEVYTRAVELAPERPEIHFNLANAYRDSKQHDRAVRCYRKALRLKPHYLKALKNLGAVLRKMRQPWESEQCFRSLLELRPDLHDARYQLACSLLDQKRHDEAESLFHGLLARDPMHIRARMRLAASFIDQGRLDEACDALFAMERMPKVSVPVLIKLCDALREVGRYDDAVRMAELLVEHQPEEGVVYNNLGLTLFAKGRPAEAVAKYRQALALDHRSAELYNNLGVGMMALRKNGEGTEYVEQALRIQPDFALAHMNRAFAWLRAGRFREGWHEMEWRRVALPHLAMRSVKPMWEGQTLHDGSVLLVVEQGIGDTFQFVRYASAVRDRCARVVLLCPEMLHGILARCPGIDEIVAPRGELPPHDAFSPLMSLPGILRNEVSDHSADTPYILADDELILRWAEELPHKEAFRIGIAWQGNRKYANDVFRSVPLRSFAPLAGVPGVRLISLQVGDGEEQVNDLDGEFPVTVLEPKLDEQHGTFMDTAAVMASLDLIITSDTAIPHLAGATGRPVWMATGYAPDWRWMDHGFNNAWYPTMRHFRQRELDNWGSIFETMAEKLHHLVESTLSQRQTDRGSS